MNTNYKSIEEYFNLPYTIEVVRDEGEGYKGYIASVVELPGCMTQAEDFAELGEMLPDAMRAWFETCMEEGLPIPLPRNNETYSGRFVVRLPKSLHRELVEAAARDCVSLNAYVNVVLGKAVGGRVTVHEENTAEIPSAMLNWHRVSEKEHEILAM